MTVFSQEEELIRGQRQKGLQFKIRNCTGPVVFFGCPGSGRACAMASIIGCLESEERTVRELVCADDWTLAKGAQLKTFSHILGCTYREIEPKNISLEMKKESFIYLGSQVLTDIALLSGLAARKVLVVDCSRRIDIATGLIEKVGAKNIDGIVLTRLDFCGAGKAEMQILAAYQIPLLFVVWGSSLGHDCGFPGSELPSDVAEIVSDWKNNISQMQQRAKR